jgi:hypothetical protein
MDLYPMTVMYFLFKRQAIKSPYPQLASLATRLLGRHFPEELTIKQTEDFAQHLLQINPPTGQASPCDYKGTFKLTPEMAKQDILKLRQDPTLTTKNSALLDQLEEYLISKFN